MSLITINGTAIADASTYQVVISDIDADSNRNANGQLIRDRIATKRKLSLGWSPLTQEEISTILNVVSDTFFNCTFLDPKDGIITKTMYVGDRTNPAYGYDDESKEMRWKDVKMDFIEQ